MSTDYRWLVKSSDLILGPYEFDQVVESIFNGEIHLLDEIKGPFERWRPIKDHSLFAAAIEKLKATTYSQRENTITATVDLGTQTHDLTRSQTGSQTQELTKTPTMTSGSTQGTEFPVEDSEERPIYQPQVNGGGVVKAPPRKPKTYGAFLMSFLLLLVAGAGYLIYEFQQTKLIEQKISAYDQLTDNAILHLKTGEYQKALKNFAMAYNISPNDPNLILEMAPLSVQFDGQFSQVELMVNGLLANQYKKDYTKRGKNIIGLTYSYRTKFQEALAMYDEVISVDRQFLPPKINKAFVLLKLKRPKDAVELMRTVVTEFPDEAIAHYLYIRSLVELGMKSQNKAYYQEALSVSRQFSRNFSDLKQEVSFLIALAKMKLQVTGDELERLVKNFLRVDIELTNLHVHDTLMDFQSFNWVDYIPHCKSMMGQLSEYSAKLVEGFCFLKINRTIEAKKIFEGLLSEQDKDGVLQALYASSLLKLEELSQAKNTLGFISQVDQKQAVVETILRGCLNKNDLSCGEAIFRGRHAKHISLLYSHWGNSEIHVEKDRKRAKSSIQLGLEISPNFAPLLKLKRQL